MGRIECGPCFENMQVLLAWLGRFRKYLYLEDYFTCQPFELSIRKLGWTVSLVGLYIHIPWEYFLLDAAVEKLKILDKYSTFKQRFKIPSLWKSFLEIRTQNESIIVP